MIYNTMGLLISIAVVVILFWAPELVFEKCLYSFWIGMFLSRLMP